MTFRALLVIVLSQAVIIITFGKESESFDIPLASDPEIAKTLSGIKAVSASHRTYSIYEDGKTITTPSNTIKEACAKYADIHFEGTPVEERTFYAFYKPNFSEDKSEAEVALIVARKIWGYRQLLKLERKEKKWVLVQEYHTARYSFEAEEGYTAVQPLTGTKINIDGNSQKPQQGGSENPDKPDTGP